METENVKYEYSKYKYSAIGVLLSNLSILSSAVVSLLYLYERCPWLDDEVDISNIIPMSLDEWHLEINTKIEEIRTLQ